MYELGDTYQVAFPIPGMDSQSIQVAVLRNTIPVARELQLPTPEGANAVREEFCSAWFSRQIGLPMEVHPAC